MDARRWARENWHLIDGLLPRGHTPVLGIAGSQGSGKSWLAEDIAQTFGGRVAVLSLDDFYHTKAERGALASTLHPNFQTRGVPGTHDVALLSATLETLKTSGCRWPKFDKIADDRLPEPDWNSFLSAPDLIVFEGWCVGAPTQNADDLSQCVNAYEDRTDPRGLWRQHVNDQLRGPYAEVFAQIDALLFLRAPSFDCVLDWRWQQERTTYQRAQQAVPASARSNIQAFIQPFERITRHMLNADLAAITLHLDTSREVIDVSVLQ